MAEPRFFKTSAAWRAWLEKHHGTETELLVGFHKVDSGLPSMSWSESVDEALCFGWIDAVRRSRDDTSYTIRFTRRKVGSHWSKVNVDKVAALVSAGRMRPAGEAAFAARREGNTGKAAYEQAGPVTFDAERVARFQAVPEAWAFYCAQPPWYRKKVTWTVLKAKQPETRERRLVALIAACAAGKRL